MNVLVISYAYPPISAPGAIRVGKWRKYLPEFGWQPTILTVDGGYSRMKSGEAVADEAVIRVADAEWKTRLPTASASGGSAARPTLKSMVRKQLTYLMIPDRDRTWIKPATAKLRELLRSHSFDAVVSSFPTMSNHLVAQVAKTEFGLPWIADFRDPWIHGPHYEAPFWRRSIDAKIERRVVEQADALTVVSQFIKSIFTNAYPASASKFHVLYNGFDEDDLKVSQPVEDSRFRMVYAGSFYGGRRSPLGLFRAMSILRNEGLIRPETFVLQLIGGKEDAITRMAAECGVEDLIDFAGMKSYQECLAHQMSANVLVALTATDALSRGEMTTKLFEYLAVRKPILALAPPDFELAETVRSFHAGEAFHPNDAEHIAAWLRKTLEGQLPALDGNIEALSRRSGTKILTELLQSVAHP